MPAFGLDRQIRDALGRVELVRVDERAGGTGVDAERARAALIERRRVGRAARRLVAMPDRNSHEPSSGLITQEFLPIQPMPA